MDICFYIATIYTVYYIWLCNVWEKILPRLNFNTDVAAQEKAKFERLQNKTAQIGTWGKANDEGVPNDQVLCLHLFSYSVVIILILVADAP